MSRGNRSPTGSNQTFVSVANILPTCLQRVWMTTESLSAHREDYITRRTNTTPFSFTPYARSLISCNEIPRNYGDRSERYYRRRILIRFANAVPPEKRDPNLLDKLTVERDGIFMWALTGLKRLMANSYLFSETDATRAELQRYKVESNSALSFIEECCVLDAKRNASARSCSSNIGNIATKTA